MKMKKPPYLSHLLIGEALLEKRPVSISLGADQFFVRHVEKVMTDYRRIGSFYPECWRCIMMITPQVVHYFRACQATLSPIFMPTKKAYR